MILPDPPYDIPKLKEMTANLCAQLDEAARGVQDPALRQPITEAAESYRRIVADFEREHAQMTALIGEKNAQAQAKLKEAQAKLKEAQEKIEAGKKAAPLSEPDWALGPQLRDEILAQFRPPPPAPSPARDSLAQYAISPQPLPQAPLPTSRPAEHSIACWLDAQKAPPPHAASASDSHQSFASWLCGPSDESGSQSTSSAEEWKRWLHKPRGPGKNE